MWLVDNCKGMQKNPITPSDDNVLSYSSWLLNVEIEPSCF